MSKKNFILRYLLIIRKIQRGNYVSMNELIDHILREAENRKFYDEKITIGVDKRTIRRDFNDIRDLFGIDIEYSHTNRGYFIQENSYESKFSQRLLDEFEIFQSLKLTSGISDTVDIELQKPRGIENIYGILHAIKKQLKVNFIFHQYYLQKKLHISGNPYAIKEFKNRWYVVIKEEHEDFYTTYGLDRISDFFITEQKFKKNPDFNIKKVFEHNFGIMTGYGLPPKKIVLSFERLQGQYVKYTPLHHSQKILIDTDEELRISLFLIPTFDFRMELLSYGNAVKVIEPESLKNELLEIYKKSIEQYG